MTIESGAAGLGEVGAGLFWMRRGGYGAFILCLSRTGREDRMPGREATMRMCGRITAVGCTHLVAMLKGAGMVKSTKAVGGLVQPMHSVSRRFGDPAGMMRERRGKL